MRVRVDETGGDDQIRGVDDARRLARKLADLGNEAVLDGNVGVDLRCTGSVDDGAVLDQQVVRHGQASFSAFSYARKSRR